MPGLDRVVSDDARRATLLELAARALDRLRSLGDPIPRPTLNALRDWGEGYGYQDDVAAANFVRPARYFVKLLDGTLGADEVDARFAPSAPLS